MSNVDPWDKMNAPPSGEFPADKWMFDRPGTTLVGEVSNIREANFPDGSHAPEMWVVDKNGVEWQVTCGPFGLQQLLFEQRPLVGDLIALQYQGETKLGGGKAKKGFKLQVKRGTVVVAAAPAYTPPPAPAPAPVAAPAPAPAMDNDLFAGATVSDAASDDLFA